MIMVKFELFQELFVQIFSIDNQSMTLWWQGTGFGFESSYTFVCISDLTLTKNEVYPFAPYSFI